MFHHFHDGVHPAGPGSLSAADFDALIRYIGRERILSASEFMDRALHNALRDEQTCLTFDDNLRCQYDVALPVLDRYHIQAFWFVNTAVLHGTYCRLELYRKFRLLHFQSENAFYDSFFETVKTSDLAGLVENKTRGVDFSLFLKEFSFYTYNDRKFRYLRDEVLSPGDYDRIMDLLLARAGVSLESLASNTWIERESLANLHASGHLLGLHSYTHPTRLAYCNATIQRREYEANLSDLESICGRRPLSMSHPCNSYTPDTLNLLRELGVRVGFRSNAAQKEYSLLELPRYDHADIFREMKSRKG